jgi:NADPH-dependent glutamate synthase beta subunit-like oxidoreductase/NAD(P)H-flavin reductase
MSTPSAPPHGFAFAPPPRASAAAPSPDRALGAAEPLGRLGVDDFTYRDLYEPNRLAALDVSFRRTLAAADPGLARRFEAYRAGAQLPRPEDSDLLLAVARELSRFVARLFGIEAERDRLLDAAAREHAVFQLKEFVARRATKKYGPGALSPADAAPLHARVRRLAALAAPAYAGGPSEADAELALAHGLTALLGMEARLRPYGEGAAAGSAPDDLVAELDRLRAALSTGDAASDLLGAGAALGPSVDPADDLRLVRALLDLFERWGALHAHDRGARGAVAGWVSFRVPRKIDHAALVPVERLRPELPNAAAGPPEHRRRRDGFALTDRRASPRQVAYEVDYCLYCHERQKDSCAHGMRDKDGAVKKNPLGVALEGCPLDERISEMHLLKKGGDSIGALAVVVVDNPMCAGTGHRICNDCMKACIFQKQEPVNIPQAETGVLTDVLDLPWGFEIYALLCRWNPLNRARPFALPYNGKNVLVVGLGPAGYTLAHHLANEGFGVAAIDGLKIEPLPADLVGGQAWPPRPVEDWRTLTEGLDERVLAGFGGVAEYGITVRWDKNFLTVLQLLLARRTTIRIYGGVRFGGTIDVEDAFALGFHHVAIAAGAGKPTIIDVENNLLRGVRKASDFLMTLQLQGAFRRGSLANLQIRLPALVVGGGLTGIDATTELAAYYPVQVEKFLERWERLAARDGEEALFARYDDEEAEIARELLAHGRAVRAERARAAAAGEAPDLARLVTGWGGVALVYRKGMQDAPAYRLNHEEIEKFLEEGVEFIEGLAPRACVPDRFGALAAVDFEGRGGERVRLPARTLIVAAGTSPNTTYEQELPGTFEIDPKLRAFRPYRAVRGEDGAFRLEPAPPQKERTPEGTRATPPKEQAPRTPAPHEEIGFFTSYAKAGRFVTFYGDNHPVYAGSVVKAMASAKHGFPAIAALFADELAALRPEEQPARDEAWAALAARLDDELRPTVHEVRRLTPTIVEVVVRAPAAARRFAPGQFFRLNNYERLAPRRGGTPLVMEGLALTGAWVDRARGLLSMIVLEMGGSSRLVAGLRPGEPVVVMGPTGAPTEIPRDEAVVLCGGGLGNAVLFSIARALKEAGCRVLYFAAYRKREDIYKIEEIEAATDQVIWSVDGGPLPEPRRSQDRAFRGNVVEAMAAFARGELGTPIVPLADCTRVVAIGSDRMMAAVRAARHGVLAPHLRTGHVAIASINSPMQCMMKEICAQCLQRWVDPATGKETFVFSCSNQDQPQDLVDWRHLADRLRQNTVWEKLTDRWVQTLL